MRVEDNIYFICLLFPLKGGIINYVQTNYYRVIKSTIWFYKILNLQGCNLTNFSGGEAWEGSNVPSIAIIIHYKKQVNFWEV